MTTSISALSQPAPITLAPGPLFTTNVDPALLWRAWLDSLHPAERQEHNCHACRRFVERYGNLVTVDQYGHSRAAMDIFQSMIGGARVTGVFVSSAPVWGTPSNPDRKRGCTWQHMHVVPPAETRYRGGVLTASQRAAELGEDYATLCRALAEFKLETLQQALRLADADTLYRSEKIAGRLKWLIELSTARGALKGRARDNVTWRAVASAPAGFCHVRSSVVGSLLEDLEAGKPFDAVKRAFDAKMHPLQYQRPTAPPTAGNIKQAEELVEKLGVRSALRRRFARLEDLQTVWTPKPVVPGASGGVFDHLVPGKSLISKLVASAPPMTWEKFARTVLPIAERVELQAPSHGYYTALVTAADPDATPILQWDREGARNPVSWYTYSSGSSALQWNIRSGLVEVTAMSLMPNMWQPGFDHHGKGVFFVLKGCRDAGHAGLSLFPELLKSDYHGIRATIEAFSRAGQMEGADEATACGLTIRSGRTTPVMLRVYSSGTITDYIVDRWD